MAAKIPGFKLTENEVSQTLDLKEILGIDVSNNQEIKDAIGQAIIDRIIERTESGKSIHGKDFKKAEPDSNYSHEYRDSHTFKAYGKNNNKINMTLTGNMLGTMDIIKDEKNKITIGWDDPTENAKAYNHNFGDTVPKREFFGITTGEINEIARKYKPDLMTNENDERLLNKIAKLIGKK